MLLCQSAFPMPQRVAAVHRAGGAPKKAIPGGFDAIGLKLLGSGSLDGAKLDGL